MPGLRADFIMQDFAECPLAMRHVTMGAAGPSGHQGGTYKRVLKSLGSADPQQREIWLSCPPLI
jgi:hypothetical protein